MGGPSRLKVSSDVVSLSFLPVATMSLTCFCAMTNLIKTGLLPVGKANRKSWLGADYTIDCNSMGHFRMQCLSVFVLISWCVVVPGMLSALHKDEKFGCLDVCCSASDDDTFEALPPQQ